MALTYDQFINEVKSLITKIEGFSKKDLNAQSEAFKDWKFELGQLILHIHHAGYIVNCAVDTRAFYIREAYSPVSIGQQEDKFKADLQDTLRELKLIIGNYAKFGEPESLRKTAKIEISEKKKELEFPSQITFEWVRKHVPVDWFWKAVVGLCVVIGFSFGAGVWYGSVAIPMLKSTASTPKQSEIMAAPVK